MSANQEALRRFHYGLDQWREKVRGHAIMFAKRVAFMILGGYVMMPDGSIRAHTGVLQLTPVDTGRAVGNWMVSLDALDQSTIEEGFGTSGQAGNRSAAEMAAMKSATSRLASFRLGQSIWIANSLPYILVLNDGGENRTAHHMMERALDNTKRALAAGRN